MSFFNSDVVRAEMAEISELQEEIYTNVFKFPTMSLEDKRYHIEILERLVDKQQVLYTRLSLSDDPEAKKMKDKVLDSAKDLGLPANIDMNIFFKNMNEMVEVMRREIDNKDSLS